MTILDKLFIDSFKNSPTDFRHELRIDWRNGRHQAVHIKELSPDGVIEALKEMASLLEREKKQEHL